MNPKKLPPDLCTTNEELLSQVDHATRRIDDAIAHNAAVLASLFDPDGEESVLEVLAEVLNGLNSAALTLKKLVAEEAAGSETAEIDDSDNERSTGDLASDVRAAASA